MLEPSRGSWQWQAEIHEVFNVLLPEDSPDIGFMRFKYFLGLCLLICHWIYGMMHCNLFQLVGTFVYPNYIKYEAIDLDMFDVPHDELGSQQQIAVMNWLVVKPLLSPHNRICCGNSSDKPFITTTPNQEQSVLLQLISPSRFCEPHTSSPCLADFSVILYGISVSCSCFQVTLRPPAHLYFSSGSLSSSKWHANGLCFLNHTKLYLPIPHLITSFEHSDSTYMIITKLTGSNPSISTWERH